MIDRDCWRPTGSTRSSRGLSEVVGYALLIAVVVTIVSVLLLTGGNALDDNERTIEVAQAEHAMMQLDSQASRVALGESTSQQVDMGFVGSDGTLRTRPDRGWIRVQIVNASDGTTENVVNKTSLGAITYDHGETTVAYQGGGVWRTDGASTVMLSRPEFHYRNGTLSLPIITADGESVYSDAELTGDGSAVRKFPNETAGWENKVENETVAITVQSEYYEGWGQFFEETTNAIVSYDHANEAVVVKFLALPRAFEIKNGVIATSGPGKIELAGTGAYIDSYNSSKGDYATTNGDNGRVESAGDVNLTGDATIDGEVWSGGVIDIDSSSATINGDVYHTDGFENKGTHNGNVTEISGVKSLEPIDGLVRGQVASLRAANNNTQTAVIEGSKLDIDGSTGELDPGNYYLTSMSLAGEKLVLNATEGNITIGVRDWIKLNRSQGTGGKLEVKGNGTVHIFVEGDKEVTAQITGGGSRQVNLHAGKSTKVHIPDNQSHQLRIYGKSDMNATIAGSNGNPATFNGVIYAPAGEFGPGYTYVKHADVYGAIVSGNLTLGNKGKVHFDRGLEDEEFPLAPTASRLEFLYVTEHRFTVSSLWPLLAVVVPRRVIGEIPTVSAVKSGGSADESVIYECRRCGKALDSAEAACPYCGPTDVAEFEIE